MDYDGDPCGRGVVWPGLVERTNTCRPAMDQFVAVYPHGELLHRVNILLNITDRSLLVEVKSISHALNNISALGSWGLNLKGRSAGRAGRSLRFAPGDDRVLHTQGSRSQGPPSRC